MLDSKSVINFWNELYYLYLIKSRQLKSFLLFIHNKSTPRKNPFKVKAYRSDIS